MTHKQYVGWFSYIPELVLGRVMLHDTLKVCSKIFYTDLLLSLTRQSVHTVRLISGVDGKGGK